MCKVVFYVIVVIFLMTLLMNNFTSMIKIWMKSMQIIETNFWQILHPTIHVMRRCHE